MLNHKTKPVVVDGEQVKVDEELVLLISELNRLGLKTANCCQGGTEEIPFAYVSVCLDDGYFCYDPETRILTFRWNRTDMKFLPTCPYIHVKEGIMRLDELMKTACGRTKKQLSCEAHESQS